VGREGSFESFKASVSLDDLIANAKDVLLGASVPVEIRDETLARLTKSQLSESLRQLIFNYKTAFELLRREDRSRSVKGLSNILKPTAASGRGLA
jgi:hypothetical protein